MIRNINEGRNDQEPQQLKNSDVTFHECSCGNDTFLKADRIGELSPVHPKNPTGEKQLIPYPAAVCAKCGERYVAGDQ